MEVSGDMLADTRLVLSRPRTCLFIYRYKHLAASYFRRGEWQEARGREEQIDKKVVEPYADLVVGNRVAIRKGPMTGIEGVLVHKQNGTRFIFTVHLIQKSVSIQIGAEDLEALES